MRLLRYDDGGEFSLTSHLGNDTPRYAILSHTWGPDTEEVTFKDLIDGTGKSKLGYNKIRFCGEQARRDGLQYFWVDTCCIEKSSSSELTEAINSMFQWYQSSTKCYVYLSDALSPVDTNDSVWESAFRKSRWFTRSWTLQELIAPRSVEFFSKYGELLGDKSTLERHICEITGLPAKVLRGSPLSDFSITERMSWTRGRNTVREEDQAYSLLGIFNVHMALIYGEGSNAFRRLQEEIRKSVSISPKSTRAGMRLLVARSDPLRMETVPISDSLQYAILSHTWGEDEVLFDDMRSATAEQKQGYSKIRQCCNLAVKHGFEYVWVDTCCIDKSSSSELQEAICSMYTWYQNAKICYVYLEDSQHGSVDSFIKCKWFKRGWTLQELIAPAFVEFYDQNWNEIGTKQSLCDQIAIITSIDPLVLRGAPPTSRTIAERMSWAAYRSTTRIEDAAYSLMGLFNVFMPMLYGEGKRAFIRLQEEIIKQTEDYTIFSWKANIPGATSRGIFAHSPDEFRVVGPGQIVPRLSYPHQQPDQYPPPSLTSRGLVLTLPVLECTSDKSTFLGWVSCSSPKEDDSLEEPTLLCIRLREIRSTPQLFARSSPEKLEARAITDLHHFKQQTICVLPSNVDQIASLDTPRIGEFVVHASYDSTDVVALMQVGVANWARWWDEDKRLTYSYQEGTYPLAAIRFEIEEGFVVVIGFHEDIPWCSIVTPEDIKQHGRTLHNLEDLNILSRSCTRHTDRAKKMLSPTRAVAAAVRVARFTNSNAPRFSLHVYSSTVQEAKEIYKRGLVGKEKLLGAERTSSDKSMDNNAQPEVREPKNNLKRRPSPTGAEASQQSKRNKLLK